MALRFKLQFVVDADDDQQVSVDELVVLDKDYERLEQLGLTLAEAESSVPTSERGLITGTATTTPAHAAFFRPDWDRPQAKMSDAIYTEGRQVAASPSLLVDPDR